MLDQAEVIMMCVARVAKTGLEELSMLNFEIIFLRFSDTGTTHHWHDQWALRVRTTLGDRHRGGVVGDATTYQF